MEQLVQTKGGSDFSGGLVTYPNFFAVPPNATPNCVDVKFRIGGSIEKRLGSTTLNATALVPSTAPGFRPDTNSTLSTSLISFFRMEEGAGNRADAFGTNDLTASNNPLSAAGIVGNAVLLTASSSQYLMRSNNATLAMASTSFTISAWVYLASTTNLMTIASKLASGAGNFEYSLTYSASSARFQWQPERNTVITASTLGAPALNTWYFLLAWWDSANSVGYLRVNALVANSLTVGSGPEVTTTSFGVGTDFGSSGNPENYFDGRIDEVGIWKKVLSAQEQTDLYNSGNGNTYNPSASQSGWGMFDFGAGFGSDGKPLRWLVVAAGTGVYASSNRGVTFVVIATDRGADYQYFERSKSLLIATSNTQNKVLYWAGSVGTFMAALPVGSAPPVTQALDFAGFLLLMNDSANKRRVSYADNTKILTDPFSTTFEVPGQLDDEITGGITFNRSAYVFTRYTVSRVSSVGGNPDFAVQPVKSWGAVPGTIKRVTYGNLGEVIISLGWDRHVRIFDGTDDQIISTPIEEPNGISPVFLNGMEPSAISRCRAEVDTEEQVYRLLIVMSPSSQTTHTLCLNLRTGAWYPYLNNQNFNATVVAESGNTRILTGVTRSGFVHWINTTNTDAGTAINEYFQSPFLYGQTPRMLSKAQKIALYFLPTSSGTLYYQERVNFTSTFEPVRERIVLSDTSSMVQVRKVIDLPVMQNVYQWQLSSSANTNVPWRLTRVDYEHREIGVGAA